MNKASDDIREMLEDSSALGLVYKTNLFIAKEPSSPDNCVTVYDTPSFPADKSMDNTYTYYRSSVQIRVRNNSYSNGMALAWDIMESLHDRAQLEWNGTLYTVIQAMGEPVSIAWDENNRAIIVINFNLQRR